MTSFTLQISLNLLIIKSLAFFALGIKIFITLIGEENLNKLNDLKIISIGPITTKTIEEFGLKVYRESEEATIDSMIAAISQELVLN